LHVQHRLLQKLSFPTFAHSQCATITHQPQHSCSILICPDRSAPASAQLQ